MNVIVNFASFRSVHETVLEMLKFPEQVGPPPSSTITTLGAVPPPLPPLPPCLVIMTARHRRINQCPCRSLKLPSPRLTRPACLPACCVVLLQIKTIAIIAEGVPESQTRDIVNTAAAKGVGIIGPATVSRT